MVRDQNKTAQIKLFASMSATFLITIVALIWTESIHAQILLTDLLWPILRLTIFISIGITLGQVIESTGWTKYLALISRPLFNFGNLGYRCGAAFTTAFFSGAAANAMLFDFFKEKKIPTAAWASLFLVELLDNCTRPKILIYPGQCKLSTFNFPYQ